MIGRTLAGVAAVVAAFWLAVQIDPVAAPPTAPPTVIVPVVGASAPIACPGSLVIPVGEVFAVLFDTQKSQVDPDTKPMYEAFVNAAQKLVEAGTQGYLDDLKVTDIHAFEDGLYKYLDSAQSALIADLTTKKALDDDLRSRLHAALKEYSANFKAELAAATA